MDQDPVEELVEFIDSIDRSMVPNEATTVVNHRFLDTVGVIIAGKSKEPARTLQAKAAEFATEPLVEPYDTAELGLVLGTTGHCLDYDDSTHSTHAHLSVTIIPTILALSASRDIDGADAQLSYITGFEAAYYLAQFLMNGHYEQGWHGTSTLGTFASTATAAQLLDLDRSQIADALNMAASMPAGLRANFGSMTKPLHAGLAVRSGLTATQLAARGVMASEIAITGKYGFMNVYTGSESWEQADTTRLGEDWGIIREGANSKLYPCCHETHAGIQAALALLNANEIDTNDIDEVQVRCSQLVIDNLQYDDPEVPAEAKFSMHYVIAGALYYDAIPLELFTVEGLSNAGVQSLRQKVSLEQGENLTSEYETTVTITMCDGTRYEHTIVWPPGVEESVTEEQIREKFELCTAELTPDERYRLRRSLSAVGEMEDISIVLSYCLDNASSIPSSDRS